MNKFIVRKNTIKIHIYTNLSQKYYIPCEMALYHRELAHWENKKSTINILRR